VSKYSVTCSVGSLPNLQTDITVYGDLGKNVSKTSAYMVNQDHLYYPFNAEDGYTVAIVYLNGQDVTASWNDASLEVDYDTYHDLNGETIFRRRNASKVIYLGRDAFNFEVNNVTHPDQDILFPDQSSIKLNISDFTIDAVLDFSYSRAINVLPVYGLTKGGVDIWDTGSAIEHPNIEPVQIDTQYPIETDITVTMIADTYQIREIKDRIQSAPRTDLSIDICDAQDHSNIINSFVGKNVRLISEQINSTINEEMNISLSYKSYESYHNQF
jgi:hypothetical protein